MKKLFIFAVALIMLLCFSAPSYSFQSNQQKRDREAAGALIKGFFWLKNKEEENTREREREEQRIWEMQQQERRTKTMEEQNRIEAERIKQIQMRADQERKDSYEKNYWKDQKEVVQQAQEEVPSENPESLPSVYKPPYQQKTPSKKSIGPTLKAIVGKIVNNKIYYNIPMGLSWNPNPCIVSKYEKTPCDNCPSGFKTKITLQKKEIRNQCWQENPQFAPMGGDKNYKIGD